MGAREGYFVWQYSFDRLGSPLAKRNIEEQQEIKRGVCYAKIGDE